MSTAWVTGANGFIGAHLVRALGEAGWQVERPARDIALNKRVDAVYHLAGLAHARARGVGEAEMFAGNVDRTLASYRRAVEQGVGRFVWLSSIKVLGDSSPEPLKVDAPYRPGDVYARSKAAAEEALLAEPCGDTDLCIVRPPLVYGPGVGANFLSLAKAALSGWPLPLQSAIAARAWVGVHNLVDLLMLLAQRETLPEPRVWHVRDDEQSSVREMIALLAAAAGRPVRRWALNPTIALAAGKLVGRKDAAARLFLPFPVDMTPTTDVLGWRPPHTQAREIDEVIQWYLTR